MRETDNRTIGPLTVAYSEASGRSAQSEASRGPPVPNEGGRPVSTVYLDSMSPSDFEGFCRDVFESVYSCPVILTPYSGDEGRDLIIQADDGWIYVECKHYARASVGRPVVQKLLGAMIGDGIPRGIVVTSGRFTRQAREFVERNRLDIALIDRERLSILAIRAGYRLESAPEHVDAGAMSDAPDMPIEHGRSPFSGLRACMRRFHDRAAHRFSKVDGNSQRSAR